MLAACLLLSNCAIDSIKLKVTFSEPSNSDLVVKMPKPATCTTGSYMADHKEACRADWSGPL